MVIASLPPVVVDPVGKTEQPTVQLNGATETPVPPQSTPQVQKKTVPVPQETPATPTAPPTKEKAPVKLPQDNHAATPPPQQLVQEAEKSKKRQSFLTRTLWTFIMIGGFIGMYFDAHLVSATNVDDYL